MAKGDRMNVDVYQDQAGEWRWRLKAANGRIVADSGEGYGNQADCLAMVDQLFPVREVRVTGD